MNNTIHSPTYISLTTYYSSQHAMDTNFPYNIASYCNHSHKLCVTPPYTTQINTYMLYDVSKYAFIRWISNNGRWVCLFIQSAYYIIELINDEQYNIKMLDKPYLSVMYIDTCDKIVAMTTCYTMIVVDPITCDKIFKFDEPLRKT